MEKVKNALLGIAVGDALGVPVEFKTREYLEQHPVTGMTGNGTYNQPPGTWSDDSSLTFCLAEAIAEGYSLERTARKFIRWRNEGYWGAHHSVFDIGATTNIAISRLEYILENGGEGELKKLKETQDEYENGNGSLMRILPLLFEIQGKEITEQFEMVWENSALTHRHIRAAMSCMIYLKLAEFLLAGEDKFIAYKKSVDDIRKLWEAIQFPASERKHFKRVIAGNIFNVSKSRIRSGGYVIDSLEASLWCFMKFESFRDAVLSAVNLGHDTDTTATITGGLAVIYHGIEGIPEEWLASLARREDIINLGEKLAEKTGL
ncbi:MAG: ADP-ribosylglycohydrolase family protein [Mariniphaga sp.]|nr:ADP-ribosylglycohydrolase family protein [Mariniphaga sp.]